MATVMTWNRRKVEIDAVWMEKHASLFGYTQARDGVWVPVADLEQYEKGKRPFCS